MNTFRLIRLATLVGVMFTFIATATSAERGVIGAVYTMTNDASGNQVIHYDRLADGSLQYSAHYDTEGLGSGGGLGNQGGVVLSDDGRWLLVVNAGSHDVSVFRVGRRELVLTDTELSGGMRPVSVAIDRNLVYVVHAGSDNISALLLGNHGDLTPLPGSSADLSQTGAGPAQIQFSPDGRFVLVTEKAANTISVFPIDSDGYSGSGIFNASAGTTPFALDFGPRQRVFVSEVFGGAPGLGSVSSYQLRRNGMLETLAASVPNFETAPCWLKVTRGGRYVFTTNTPDDSLSAYATEFDGGLTLVDADGRTGEPGPGTGPLDMDLSGDGRHLYTLNSGIGTISTFRVGPDGSLTETSTTEVSLPSSANGLAAR